MKPSNSMNTTSQKERPFFRFRWTYLLLALSIVAYFGAVTFRYVRDKSRALDATVTIDREEIGEALPALVLPRSSTFPDEGEVYRTADRLRAAASLAYVAALYVVEQETHNRRPASAESILASLAARNLYPPGVVYDDVPGWLSSDFATIQLRYKSEPAAIEVLSFGDSEADGPALLVRIPGEGEQGERGVLFIANKLGRINAPSPFGSATDLAEAGWIEHPLHNLDITDEQKRDIRNWLASIRSKKEQ